MSLQLPNNCRIGKMSVHPKNWEDPGADISIDWYIHYRFHAPELKVRYPKGYPVHVKGMNDIKGLAERRRITRGLLENEKKNLLRGYNPILGKIVAANELEISPSAGFIAALKRAFDLLPPSISKKKIENILPHLNRAAGQLGYDNFPVGDIDQHHLEILLLQIARNKEAEYKEQREKSPTYSNKTRKSRRSKKKPIPEQWGVEAFNSYRAYLQILFKQLKKVGATKVKPVDDIEKKKGVKKLRKGITAEEFRAINDLLRPNYYTFWRLIHMFFPSGARETEFMGIQKEHVELDKQGIWVLVKKGNGQWEWKWKTIIKSALSLWEEVMQEAKPGNYLFSKGLRPGPVRISARQLTIRWRWHVKEKLGINKDFYELKHSFTTKVVSMALKKIEEATMVAAEVNGHTTTAMNKKVYDLQAGDRLHEELKDVDAHLGS